MKTNNRPNIVVIMSDDHGYWAMGCAGNDEIYTPNLDRLAESGIRFENFFCASPVCSPARASFFTGKIPSQHGIHDWINKGHIQQEQLSDEVSELIKSKSMPEKYGFIKDQLQGDLAIEYLEGHTCFTEVLSNNGYKCGLSGKWHLGDSGKVQAGFDYWRTTALGGDNYYTSIVWDGHKFSMLKDNYLTDHITDNAIEFIEEAKNGEAPFYLSVHYTAPHAPWAKEQHPEDIYNRYENCPFKSVPNEKPHPWNVYQYVEGEAYQEQRIESLKGYYTAVTAMDKGIGQIIDYLEKHHLIDNTLILFTSDNGMSMGHHGIFGKGNGTFPLNMYETAIKVPTIISYPRAIEQGKISYDLLSHYDIMPTIIDYLHLKNEVDLEVLPGRSFASLLKGEALKDENEIVIMDEYGPTRMIRTKEWKYIHRYPYGPSELYDLANDPSEQENLASDYRYESIKLKLNDKLNEWFYTYTDTRVDGRVEPVTGQGQLGKCGFYSQGQKSFI